MEEGLTPENKSHFCVPFQKKRFNKQVIFNVSQKKKKESLSLSKNDKFFELNS